MIKLLSKFFIKNSENVTDGIVREKYSILAGIIGIICNLFLFALKAVIGTVMGSIAIISDAFNNLSDTGSSLVSIIGSKLSNARPDKEHPFGHGRLEYISSLIVSFIIMLVGFELLKASVTKIFKPEDVSYNPILAIILCVSVLVKLWMYKYNKFLGNKISSGVLLATARDSLNDTIATSAVVVTTIVNNYINFPELDGIVGTVVSVLIMYSGFEIARDTIGVLLGTPPTPELIKSINDYIISAEGIVGVHDLIVHDYGPGRIIASVHAEVPDSENVVKIHETIDALEHQIEREMGIHMVIHMDPVAADCERTSQLKAIVLETVKSIDEKLNIHDFRMTDGENNINLIFDLEVPIEYDNHEKLKNIIRDKLKEADDRFSVVIDVDTVY